MSNFPTISGPSLPVGEKYPDPAIRSQAEGGYEMTRPRFTRVPGEWELSWPAMTDSDYQTLMTFYRETAIGGSVYFNWTCATDGTAKVVRFGGEPKAEVIAWTTAGTPKYWSVGVSLKEV